MSAKPKFVLAAIILAAGKSSRMGQPKMLLPWDGDTILGHEIKLWSSLAAQVAVVHATGDSSITAELDRLNFPVEHRIPNPDAVRGMFSSIQCAARWNRWSSDTTHFAIILGDQPHIRASTLRSLLDFAQQHSEKICQPSHAGHARHPVLLPKEFFKALADSNAHSLKDFLGINSHDVALIELNDPGLALDVDEPEDYQAALKISKHL